ncbi:hypothetical protein [Brevibacillus choshinensis]|uniref:hypothetical protein n=1 Tax=Brevibacillus choshinensis TaxID=54911 RepID=UPI002E24F663|nr:hypothetical protein [Brevibacillus choshinensis]
MLKKYFLYLLAIGLVTCSFTPLSGQPTAALAVEKQSTSQTSQAEQLKLLESAIVPTTAQDTVELWAKAVQMRNGALQYALFTQNAKLGVKAPLESFHWVTGASSPWVEQYRIERLQVENEQPHEQVFQVEFDLVTSKGTYGTDQAKVTVVQQGHQWFIQGLGPVSEKSVGIWNTPESINEKSIEDSFTLMKTYDSPMGYRIQLPEKAMSQLKLESAACTNEEGNPPCLHLYFKDTTAKKDVMLATVIRLSKEQEKLPYYLEHPFIKKLGENKLGTYYSLFPSEHQYAGEEESEQGKAWSALLELLQTRMAHFNLMP